jgi:glycine/D-amino acid oxidase-like deaminating enzyme
MSLPSAARFVVIGAGVHGLSTAWHLARELKGRRHGDGSQIVVLDKTGVGAGASGIACGVIRNNYFQPAMRELMAHSVGIWESDPDAFSYHPVGYLQISPEAMRADVATIYQQQRAIGYRSTFVEGAADTRRYLQRIFPDWRASNVTSVLHEHRGGYANNIASLRGLAGKAQAQGVRIIPAVRVTGFCRDNGTVTRVRTSQGDIRCEQVVVAAGPWVRDLWRMLDLPQTVKIRDTHGAFRLRPMWTYWSLQEGTLEVDPGYLSDADGNAPPVVHLDSDAPLHDPDGNRITTGLWGIYFKPDFHFGGVQGGAVPLVVDRPADQVAVDPYGPASTDFGAGFARLWTAGLAHCLERFQGKQHLFSGQPSGGIGCFTPDSFPVFDRFCGNVTVIADSNHGYKMIGVGALVARELLGRPQALLEPFRFARFETGRLHPVSHSPFPWS